MAPRRDHRERERVAHLKGLPQEERLRLLENQAGIGVLDSPTFKKLLAGAGMERMTPRSRGLVCDSPASQDRSVGVATATGSR